MGFICCMLHTMEANAAFTPAATISTPFTTPEFSVNPQMAQDPSGNIITVWKEFLTGDVAALVSERQTSSGEREKPIIATPSTDFINEYQISIDKAGNAYLIWSTGVSGLETMSLFASVLPSGGQTWSPPVPLTTNANIEPPTIAANVPGKAVATWEESAAQANYIQRAAVFSAGVWSTPVLISDPDYNALNGNLAMDEKGNAIAIWQSEQTNIQAACLVGNTWSAPQIISNTDYSAAFPQISMNDSGQAVAVWEKIIKTNQTIIESATFSNGIWSAPTSLTSADLQSSDPAVGIDASGNAVAVWQVFLNEGMNAIAASHLKDNTWSPSVQISLPKDNSIEPEVSVNSKGHAAIVWQGALFNGRALSEVVLFDGTNFSAPVILSNPNLDSILQEVLMDEAGNVVVTWQATNLDTQDFVIQSSQSL